MKAEIKTGELDKKSEFPCLMITGKGSIIIMFRDDQGSVLFSGPGSIWKVGDGITSMGVHRTKFEGTLSLSN